MRAMSLSLWVLTGCVVLRGSGHLVTETRTFPSFSAVDTNNGVVVDLVVDPELEGDVALQVSADDNLMGRLITEVEGDTLVVDVDGSLSTKLGLAVEGDVPSLDGVFANNGSVLTVSNLGGERLTASADNGAVVELSGPVERLTVEAGNGAVLSAEELAVGDAEVDVHDGATASICATGVVTGSVRGGAVLDVSCGGNASGVSVSGGGVLND